MSDKEINPKAIGANARARSLSSDERSEIAKKAALARWANSEDVAKAQYKGIITIGELEIDCAVLEDGTRLLSERAITKAFGGKRGGSHWRRKKAGMESNLPVYISASNIRPFISNELEKSLGTPIRYSHGKGGVIGNGIEATMLPKICSVFLAMRDAGMVLPSQAHIVHQADMLMRGLAEIGIIALIDEATGYQEVRDRFALQKILDKYLTEEKAKWAKTFPDDFYKKMFKLRGWNFNPLSVKRPGVIGHYTNDIVYQRLAPGILKKLRELNPKTEKGSRKGKHFQHFTDDYGLPELKEHLTKIMFLMDAAGDDWDLFKSLLNKAAPKQGDTLELDLRDRED